MLPERKKDTSGSSRRVVGVPVVVQPVVVPVQLATITVEVADVLVARVPVADCRKCLPWHHPLNTLKVESNS